MSEEGIGELFTSCSPTTRCARASRAGERFMSNKQSFDRNVEQVLTS